MPTNGAESLIRTALAAGIDVCFANPGTTEMPLVAALDAVPGMRAVLGLFEGVCSGAADGYGRMTGSSRPDPHPSRDPASPTASRTCTTPAAPVRRSSM